MALRIITTDVRQTEARGVKAVITGKSGIGKTSTLFACPLSSDLFLSPEKRDEGVNN
ncbi:MAG: hypothetical protein K5Q68_18275 [Roseococcus sp.]|nr:hypothetical protein [Roseococcus sp.]